MELHHCIIRLKLELRGLHVNQEITEMVNDRGRSKVTGQYYGGDFLFLCSILFVYIFKY